MKVEFLCFVVRDKDGNVIQVEPIMDMYSQVTMELYGEYIKLDDIIEFGKEIFGNRVYECYGKKIDKFINEGLWQETQEAKDLCGKYGSITSKIEKIEYDLK